MSQESSDDSLSIGNANDASKPDEEMLYIVDDPSLFGS
jgi:hypothetical protein